VLVARCENIVSIPLVCLSIGCPLGWPAGVSSVVSMGKQPPSVWRTRGPHKVLPILPRCSRFLGGLPFYVLPNVSPLGCALLAVRACLMVLLCCAHLTNLLTRYLPYAVYPTVMPSADTRNPDFLVDRSSDQPDVAGMM
jgi:hypothetical protein